jgi:hypothetical protein
MRKLEGFSAIMAVDSEYRQQGGVERSRPVPLCICALDILSGKKHQLWGDELRVPAPPWPYGPETLMVSYNAVAELSVFHVLGWDTSFPVLDLNTEFRQIVNGILHKDLPRSQLAALDYFGLRGISTIEKECWRDVILAGGPYSPEQKQGILNYCWSDVLALRDLFHAMRPRLPADLSTCLYKGRVSAAAAMSVLSGVPVDEPTWKFFLENRNYILRRIVKGCPVYNEEATLKQDLLEPFLRRLDLLDTWPRTKTGLLSTEKQAFKDKSYIPAVERVRQVSAVVDQLDKPGFQVHRGRNFYALLPYKAESGRNSTIGCIFSVPKWLRGLIQAPPGRGLIQADYVSEEYLIGGVRSNDAAIIRTYADGDPYVSLAVAAGLMPGGASKSTHPLERSIAKTCALALQYGAGPRTLQRKSGISFNRATDLWRTHRQLYPNLWKWTGLQVQRARWERHLDSELGWRLHVTPNTRTGTLQNFGIQSVGADILHLAHILLYEAGIPVCVPVHDSFLVECAEQDLEDVAEEVRRLMILASEIVLHGHRLRVECRLLRYPDRLHEESGLDTWNRVMGIMSAKNRTTVPRKEAIDSLVP